MATFLDLGLFTHFQSLFTILFVFLAIFGLLAYKKPFGDKFMGVYGIIALIIAFMTMFSPTVVGTISNLAPWVVLFLVFIIFLLIGYSSVGMEMGDIASHVKSTPSIKWAVFITFAIMIVIAVSSSVGPRLATGQVGNSGTTAVIGLNDPNVQENQEFAENLHNIFFHPKMLGLIFILLVAISTVSLMGGKLQ